MNERSINNSPRKHQVFSMTEVQVERQGTVYVMGEMAWGSEIEKGIKVWRTLGTKAQHPCHVCKRAEDCSWRNKAEFHLRQITGSSFKKRFNLRSDSRMLISTPALYPHHTVSYQLPPPLWIPQTSHTDVLPTCFEKVLPPPNVSPFSLAFCFATSWVSLSLNLLHSPSWFLRPKSSWKILGFLGDMPADWYRTYLADCEAGR